MEERLMSALDQILPPARMLAHPISGEVINRDDLPAIKAALADAAEVQREWYREKSGFFTARHDLDTRLAELEPVQLPRRSNQTRVQERLERCPRCRTPLPRVVISDGEEREPGAVGRVASPSEDAALDEGGPEAGGAPDDSAGSESPPSSSAAERSASVLTPSLAAETAAEPTVEQSTLLPRGPRTAEQEAALGIDILGERLAASSPAPTGVVEEAQPSMTPEPEEAEVSSEDTSSGSPPLFEIPPSARSEP